MIFRCHNGMPEREGMGKRAPLVMNHLPLSKVACPTRQQFGFTAQYFNDNLSITLSERMWNGLQLRLTFSDNIPPQKFPFKIGRSTYNQTDAIPSWSSATTFYTNSNGVRWHELHPKLAPWSNAELRLERWRRALSQLWHYCVKRRRI